MAEIAIDVELADDDAKRTTGLMFRKPLPPNGGMLFVFPQAGNYAFWNNNVIFPLSLGFFDENGVLVRIKDLEAQSVDPVSPDAKIKYVLEARQGFFDSNNIKIGDKIKRLTRKKESDSLLDKNESIEDYNFTHVLFLDVSGTDVESCNKEVNTMSVRILPSNPRSVDEKTAEFFRKVGEGGVIPPVPNAMEKQASMTKEATVTKEEQAKYWRDYFANAGVILPYEAWLEILFGD